MTSSEKPRKQISTKTRFEIFKRDGFVCQYCGEHPPKIILHVDHIYPVKEGGTNDADNLVTSCDVCNRGKGARLLSNAPTSLKDKAKQVAESEAQLLGYYKVMKDKNARIDGEAWQIADLYIEELSLGGIRRDYFRSIKMFVGKLGFHEVYEAMDLAITRFGAREFKVFKYFCGICWRKIERHKESIGGGS